MIISCCDPPHKKKRSKPTTARQNRSVNPPEKKRMGETNFHGQWSSNNRNQLRSSPPRFAAMGAAASFGSSHRFSNKTEEPFSSLWEFALAESRAVTIWAAACCILRLGLNSLVDLARCSDAGIECEARLKYRTVLAGWVVGMLPTELTSDSTPGFIFALPWLLYFIRYRVGSIPSLPVRVCESMLGRLSPMQVVIAGIIHVCCVIFTLRFLQVAFHTDITNASFVEYESDDTWFQLLHSFVKETVVGSLFTVSLLVLPEILAVNRIARCVAGLIMMPIFSIPVDGTGKASTLAPVALYCWKVMDLRTRHVDETILVDSHLPWHRMAALLAGGLVAGKIMQKYFPDDARG